MGLALTERRRWPAGAVSTAAESRAARTPPPQPRGPAALSVGSAREEAVGAPGEGHLHSQPLPANQ